MNDFVFTFGFCTPKQRAANDANGWDDESSVSIGIRGASATDAEKWGCEIAEAFCTHLYQKSPDWIGSPPSWKADNFSFWVTESDSSDDGSGPKVWVQVGEMPTLDDL